MEVKITIQGVPEEVRDKLAVLASDRGLTMEEFLCSELERIASRPLRAAWLQEVRADKEATGTRIPPSAILEAIHTDRK